MSSNDKRRKWIISLGFSEAEADSFIEFEVPKWKIEALAEVLHPKPVTEPVPAPVTEPEAKPDSVATTETAPEPEVGVEAAVSEPKAEGEGFGDYLCPECKVTHRAGSKIHKRHLKLL